MIISLLVPYYLQNIVSEFVIGCVTPLNMGPLRLIKV